MLAEIASSVYVKADLTIIALVLGPVGTSVYAPAITLLQAAFLAPRALFFVVVPVLSKTYTENRDRFRGRGLSQTAAQILIGTTISVLLFLFAPLIVRLIFGEDYAASAVILRILSPLPFLRSFNFALAAILTSSARQRQRTRVQIIAAAVNVTGNLIVIVPYGIIGVSIVYLLSELVLGLGYLFLLRGQLRPAH
jgi:PST family polysaccharide transporter